MKEASPVIIVPAPEMRALIEERLEANAISFAGLSRSIGKNPSYMHHFLKRGTPRYLDEVDRPVVATLLGIDDRLLAPPGSLRAMAVAEAVASPGSPSGIDLSRLLAPDRKRIADVPAFQQYDELNPANAREWLPRLHPTNGTNGIDEMIAVRMETGRGRVEPGDTVFLSRQAARIGDTVFTLKDNRLGAWGRMMGRTDAGVSLELPEGTEIIPLARNEMLRLVAIVI